MCLDINHIKTNVLTVQKQIIDVPNFCFVKSKAYTNIELTANAFFMLEANLLYMPKMCAKMAFFININFWIVEDFMENKIVIMRVIIEKFK